MIIQTPELHPVTFQRTELPPPRAVLRENQRHKTPTNFVILPRPPTQVAACAQPFPVFRKRIPPANDPSPTSFILHTHPLSHEHYCEETDLKHRSVGHNSEVKLPSVFIALIEMSQLLCCVPEIRGKLVNMIPSYMVRRCANWHMWTRYSASYTDST